MEFGTAKTPGLFVTATDTGVGKTYLTALAARNLRAKAPRVGAYKPVCTGAEIAPDGNVSWTDVETLASAIGGEFEDRRVCPFRFRAPLAPPIAARREGAALALASLCEGARWWDGRVDALLIEGVGGLLCPLTETETIADLAAELGYPLLIVARLGLGTINHTLLTVEAAKIRGLKVAGVVLNEAEPLVSTPGIEENPREIARRAHVPVLGVVRHGGTMVERSDGPIDWLSMMQEPSPT